MQVFSCQNLLYGYTEPLGHALNLQISAGEIWHIKGENGSGKTTLLKTMAGLISPLFGAHNSAVSFYLDTKLALINDLTVKQICALWGIAPPLELQEHALCKELSFGQKRRLLLEQLVTINRPLLLLDEPYNGLGQAYRSFLDNIIKKQITHGAVVLTGHHAVDTATHVVQL